MNLRQLLRMKKWAENPPGEGRVKLVFGAVILCVILFGYERLFGWPAWLTLDPHPAGIRPR